MDFGGFWEKTDGTWLNAGGVALGVTLGLVLAGRLSERMRRTIIQGVGLVTVVIGIEMSRSLTRGGTEKIDGMVLGLLAVVGGGLLGEWWKVEEGLEAAGNYLKRRFSGGGSFTEGFVAASLLFCVGPLTLIGSLDNGLRGDTTLLGIKTTLDTLAAIALTGSYGIGVGFSILVLLVYQITLSLAAGSLNEVIPDPANDPRVLLVSGVGGVLVLGLGINLLELARIRVATFLPALALAPVLYWIADRWR